MQNRKNTLIKLSICSLAIISLCAGCGRTKDVIENTEVMSTEISIETEESMEETEETEKIGDTGETKVETTESPDDFNGDHYEGTLQETVQTYITYEDIEPTIMYVISGKSDEGFALYVDPNITEGALMMGGMLSAGEELIIDGKGTFNNQEYYRVGFKEGTMLDYQLIISSEFIVAEPVSVTPPVETPAPTTKPVEQQKPVETPAPPAEKPVEQPVEQQKPVEQAPVATPAPAPSYDSNSGISQEDWNALFGGGGSGNNGQNWTPDHGSDYSGTIVPGGSFVIEGSGFESGGSNVKWH